MNLKARCFNLWLFCILQWKGFPLTRVYLWKWCNCCLPGKNSSNPCLLGLSKGWWSKSWRKMSPLFWKIHRFNLEAHMDVQDLTHWCIFSLKFVVSEKKPMRTFPECCTTCFAVNKASNSFWVFHNLFGPLETLPNGPKYIVQEYDSDYYQEALQYETRRLSEQHQNIVYLYWDRDAKFRPQT